MVLKKYWDVKSVYKSRVAESEVKFPTPTFPKYSTPDSDPLTQSEWRFAVNNFVATSSQWKSWYKARILFFNKSLKRNCTISTGIPNLWAGLWSRSRGVGKIFNWGVEVNFNDPDFMLTFCSLIVTVCATNVRKRPTSKFRGLTFQQKTGSWIFRTAVAR